MVPDKIYFATHVIITLRSVFAKHHSTIPMFNHDSHAVWKGFGQAFSVLV